MSGHPDLQASPAWSRLRDEILAAVRARHDSTIGLLQDLVRIPSVNPWFADGARSAGEAVVQDLLGERLERLGARLDRWEPSSDGLAHYEGGPGYYAGRDFTGRPNLVARLSGVGGGRSLLILGHADVVSPGDGWKTDPFGGERRDGRIYGRGTADMKAGIAAAIGALEALADVGVRLAGDVLIASVVDEEAGGMGTLAFVDRGYRADAAIIPEPSALNVAPLCRGILWGRATVPGRSGHIEMFQPDWRNGGAVDAIALGRRILNEIDGLNERWAADPAKRHALLPLPNQVKVSMIEAGDYPTTYAEQMRMTFDAQYLPHERDQHGLGGSVKHQLEGFFEVLSALDPWLADHPITVEWLVDADCAETPPEDPLVELLQEVARAMNLSSRLEGMSSHTDMGLLVNAGIPTVNFGPGAPSVAHQADEYVDEEDLMRATAALALTYAGWCGLAR